MLNQDFLLFRRNEPKITKEEVLVQLQNQPCPTCPKGISFFEIYQIVFYFLYIFGNSCLWWMFGRDGCRSELLCKGERFALLQIWMRNLSKSVAPSRWRKFSCRQTKLDRPYLSKKLGANLKWEPKEKLRVSRTTFEQKFEKIVYRRTNVLDNGALSYLLVSFSMKWSAEAESETEASHLHRTELKQQGRLLSGIAGKLRNECRTLKFYNRQLIPCRVYVTGFNINAPLLGIRKV